MALVRGKFGIEYSPRPVDDDSPVARWFITLVVFAALALLAMSIIRRIASRPDEGPEAPVDEPSVIEQASTTVTNASSASLPVVPPPPPPPNIAETARGRSPVVQQLLVRLEKAEKAHDVELAVSTIEQIRALPGNPAADIDNALARRLGDLNIRRLFVSRSPQWIAEVTVRRGDSATRIAFERGSTLASLLKLNALSSADRLAIGQKLYVMEHPKFTLVVHRAAKYADLSLKGKFFRRYSIVAPVRAPEGNYETGAKLRTFFAERGIVFSPADCSELELLLPAKTPVLVSEL